MNRRDLQLRARMAPSQDDLIFELRERIKRLEALLPASGGTWPPNGWSDDGASPVANIDAGTGFLEDLGELTVGPNGTFERAVIDPGKIDIRQGTGVGSNTAAFFQVDADDGTVSGHKVAKVSVFMLHADDFLEVRNTGNNLRFSILASGAILMPGLPTSDPGVSGQLWNNSGVLTVSP